MDDMVLKWLAKKYLSGFVFVETAAPMAVTAVVNWAVCGIFHLRFYR